MYNNKHEIILWLHLLLDHTCIYIHKNLYSGTVAMHKQTYHAINDTRLIPQMFRRILRSDSPNHKKGFAITINPSRLFREYKNNIVK